MSTEARAGGGFGGTGRVVTGKMVNKTALPESGNTEGVRAGHGACLSAESRIGWCGVCFFLLERSRHVDTAPSGRWQISG